MITIEVLTALERQYQIFAWTGSCTPYGTKRMVAAAQKELKAALGDIASRMMFMTVERTSHNCSLATFWTQPMMAVA